MAYIVFIVCWSKAKLLVLELTYSMYDMVGPIFPVYTLIDAVCLAEN